MNTLNPQTYNTQISPTWCPGCGNFGIWAAVKTAIAHKGLEPHQFAIVYGVGCSGNGADFVKSYGFHALHGRSIPVAEGIKLANHELPVLCMAGDGDTYGEAGNHLIHSARGNHDIKLIVHDNHIYGLTTGQASPTSAHLFKGKSTPNGAIEYPVNGLALAITQGATFVAQGFAGNLPHLIDLMEKLIEHKGFGLLNVLQPCVTWNKINTFEYFKNNTYTLEKTPENREEALKVVTNTEKLPLGIIWQEDRPAYHQQEVGLQEGTLLQRKSYQDIVFNLFHEYR